MKTPLAVLTAGLVFLSGTALTDAAIFLIDLSPMGGTALNAGAPPTHYFGDHAVGMASFNEDTPIASAATGDEIGAGITFDSVSKVLSFDVGYGSDFGFVDLLGSFTAVHLHAPGPVTFTPFNTGGPVIFALGGFHTPGSTAMTGKVTGSVLLGAADEAALFDNLIYMNIHSTSDPGGEIRGQLIVLVPEPSRAMLLTLGALAIPLRRRRPDLM